MNLPLDEIVHGDSLDVLKSLPDECVHSVVTDPPYGLGQKDPTPEELIAYLQGESLKMGEFMNRPWEIPSVEVWRECFRVLKPGGHMLVFAGTRTQDIMSIGIRMAGFENRDTVATHFGPGSLQWKYGAGFPKSHDISKGIDRKKGAKRKVVGTKRGVGGENLNDIVNGREVRQTTDEGGKGVGAYGTGAKQVPVDVPITEPATPEAKQWEGWGSNLKPSYEPVLAYRKPVGEKTVVEQVLATGTGAINIDGCRVTADGASPSLKHRATARRTGVAPIPDRSAKEADAAGEISRRGSPEAYMADRSGEQLGRWPANTLLVHASGCKVVGTKKVKAPVINRFNDGMKPFGDGAGHSYESTQTGDENGEEEVPVYECAEGCPAKILEGQKPGSSRFFAQFEPEASFYYCSKASPAEKRVPLDVEKHPTTKPGALMRYLVRLVTPPGGVVLDPYVGSGTTAVAAKAEGMHFVGIEKHEPYVQRARWRVENHNTKLIKGSRVVSEPDAPIKVTEIELTDEAKEGLTVGEKAREYLLDLALSDDG